MTSAVVWPCERRCEISCLSSSVRVACAELKPVAATICSSSVTVASAVGDARQRGEIGRRGGGGGGSGSMGAVTVRGGERAAGRGETSSRGGGNVSCCRDGWGAPELHDGAEPCRCWTSWSRSWSDARGASTPPATRSFLCCFAVARNRSFARLIAARSCCFSDGSPLPITRGASACTPAKEAASEGGVSGARAARAREGRGAQGATSHKLSQRKSSAKLDGPAR